MHFPFVYDENRRNDLENNVGLAIENAITELKMTQSLDRLFELYAYGLISSAEILNGVWSAFHDNFASLENVLEIMRLYPDNSIRRLAETLSGPEFAGLHPK